MRRTLKMKPNIPFWLESKLVNDYGYYIQKRMPGEFILFVKMSNGTTMSSNDTTIQNIPPSLGRELTENEEYILERRCDTVVDFFMDPYSMMHAVRTRLNNMCQTLKYAEERKFVDDYRDFHFSLDNNKKGPGL